MERTINMTQISSRGSESNPYTSVYREVQGEVAVGDTILLADGTFTVLRVGLTFKRKTGFTETELRLRKINSEQDSEAR